jgi:hypothetical protein
MKKRLRILFNKNNFFAKKVAKIFMNLIFVLDPDQDAHLKKTGSTIPVLMYTLQDSPNFGVFRIGTSGNRHFVVLDINMLNTFARKMMLKILTLG